MTIGMCVCVSVSMCMYVREKLTEWIFLKVFAYLLKA